MATLSRRQFTVTDEAGNVVSGAFVEVKQQLVGGQPLAPLFSDRAGATPLANPFQSDSNGFAFFHIAGGVYRVRAYLGPSGAPTFEQIWDYVPAGVIEELDYSTDGTLNLNSDILVPTQRAVKTYVDNILAVQDAMVFKGVLDCSSNPNYPSADRGHTWRVSVAGKIGGASGTNVENGDLLICQTDGTAAGTQAAVGAQWDIVQSNLDGAVIGPASSGNGNIPLFNGTTGKLIQDSGKGAPSGSFVGTTDAQTLTNKTLTSPVINVGSDATGDLYYRNGSGLYTRLGIGSSGNVLTVSGGVPSWQSGSSASSVTIGTTAIASGTTGRLLYDNAAVIGEASIGAGLSLSAGVLAKSSGLVLLETLSPSNAATAATSVSWSGYRDILFVVENLSSNNTGLPQVQLTAGGLQTSGYSSGASTVSTGGASVWATGQTSSSSMLLMGTAINGNTIGMSGSFTLYNNNQASLSKLFQGQGVCYNGTNVVWSVVYGTWLSGSSSFTAATFSTQTGNITGTIKIYGLL